MACWAVWRYKNRVVFNEECCSAENWIQFIGYQAHDFTANKDSVLGLSSVIPKSVSLWTSWNPPPESWFKLNIDGHKFVIALCLFGIMDLQFNHVNVHYVVVKLHCWSLVKLPKEERHNPEVAEILQKVQAYNRLFGGQTSGLIQRMQDLPFLLRRLVQEMMDPQRSLPLVIRARVYIAMILSAIYILSPVDIIPEGILGIFGLLDDLLIGLMCFLHVAAVYRSVLYYRHGGS
ncbi:hypothetical protein GH714_021224 [Hevea brasiliensis]|uniref:DUF1232 domain-containing protein n=1 Tax=Hevea brasiliensis TaxID=3981 RepID=A0A6A6L7E3_HEVBR|nr:hypothetical protein GH714_021224 [Hevea brasiliensis]